MTTPSTQSSVQAELVQSSDRLLAVDFNDQYHAIHRLWGDRVLNVKALLNYVPWSDAKLAFAKAPSARLVANFDRMLKFNEFDTHYLYGASKHQSCLSLFICRTLQVLSDYGLKEVILVSSDPGMVHLSELLFNLGYKPSVYGFGVRSPFHELPPIVLTPIPVGHHIGLSDGTRLG